LVVLWFWSIIYQLAIETRQGKRRAKHANAIFACFLTYFASALASLAQSNRKVFDNFLGDKFTCLKSFYPIIVLNCIPFLTTFCYLICVDGDIGMDFNGVRAEAAAQQAVIKNIKKTWLQQRIF
jgi:hypothetical protein